jgi:Protein of unknown function (DUF2867)
MALVESMRLPASAHTAHPWRIHGLAGDFQLLDVWALPTPGGPDDFPRLVEVMASFDPTRSSSVIVRGLFAIRFGLGELLGWDSDAAGLGSRVPRLRDRLPADPRARPVETTPALDQFQPVYLLDDEAALEIANRTVHGILHLGWVGDDGGYRGQMAVLVKRNGVLGAVYMAAIEPFRHLFVYPQMMREIGQRWEAQSVESTPVGSAAV